MSAYFVCMKCNSTYTWPDTHYCAPFVTYEPTLITNPTNESVLKLKNEINTLTEEVQNLKRATYDLLMGIQRIETNQLIEKNFK